MWKRVNQKCSPETVYPQPCRLTQKWLLNQAFLCFHESSRRVLQIFFAFFGHHIRFLGFLGGDTVAVAARAAGSPRGLGTASLGCQVAFVLEHCYSLLYHGGCCVGGFCDFGFVDYTGRGDYAKDFFHHGVFFRVSHIFIVKYTAGKAET